MSQADLSRVQHDLDVMKSSLVEDFPYDRNHIREHLVAAACGIPIALLAVEAWSPVVRIGLYLCFVGMIVACGRHLRQRYAMRETRQRLWQWGRREALGSAVLIVALIGYVLMVRFLGVARNAWGFEEWRNQLAGPAMFFLGVGGIVISLWPPERRSGLAWGVGFTIAGLLVPWCEGRLQTYLVVGPAFFLSGVTAAAILAWQIRCWEQEHAAD